MGWESSRVQDLEARILLTTQGKRPMLDVPFIRFRYEPEQELQCISEFNALAKRLRAKEISVETIWLNTWMLDALRQIDTIEKLQEFERSDRLTIFQDLSNIERGLPFLIASRLINHLNDKDISHCVILLRAGSMFPFVHVSSLLTLLEGKVRCTLVIPYPGKDGEMLNYRGNSLRSYYRGEIM
jgi:hypothetical protein